MIVSHWQSVKLVGAQYPPREHCRVNSATWKFNGPFWTKHWTYNSDLQLARMSALSPSQTQNSVSDPVGSTLQVHLENIADQNRRVERHCYSSVVPIPPPNPTTLAHI
jgi:hypothetical protein